MKNVENVHVGSRVILRFREASSAVGLFIHYQMRWPICFVPTIKANSNSLPLMTLLFVNLAATLMIEYVSSL